MQAIPSTTPLSRTAFWTSSVMSLTVRPPVVRRRVSCWNTFIVVAILRESLPDAALEPSHPQRILRERQHDRRPVLGVGEDLDVDGQQPLGLERMLRVPG